MKRTRSFVYGALTCDNGATTKDGPGREVRSFGRALTPETARAPMNDAASAAACQQVAL